MELFSLELLELAYKRAGLESPDKIRLFSGVWFAWMMGRLLGSRSWLVVWGYSCFILGSDLAVVYFLGTSRDREGNTVGVSSKARRQVFLSALAHVREFERHGKWGYLWRLLAWRPLKRRFGR